MLPTNVLTFANKSDNVNQDIPTNYTVTAIHQAINIINLQKKSLTSTTKHYIEYYPILLLGCNHVMYYCLVQQNKCTEVRQTKRCLTDITTHMSTIQ